MGSRPFLFIGLISYSLYLVHWPVLQLVQAGVGFQNPLPLWVTSALMVVSVPLAWLLYRFVETPGRRARSFMGARPRKSLLTALAASATCVVLAYGVNAYWQKAPLYVGEEAGALVPTPNPTPTLFVPADMRPGLRAVAGDQAAVYGDGCHLDAGEVHAKECIYGDAGAPRVVWFGDSHAAQWFPALLGWAEESGMAVESHTKSSCAATMAQPVLNGVEYWQCEAWRAEVLQRIAEDPPELVVISNLADTNGQGSADDLGYWEEGLGELLAAIPTRVVVIADTPYFDFTPSVCLSGNLGDTLACARAREEVLFPKVQAAERAAAERYGAGYLDMNDYLCGDVCAPVLGDVLVYRDGHHITATFSAALAEVLGEGLERR